MANNQQKNKGPEDIFASMNQPKRAAAPKVPQRAKMIIPPQNPEPRTPLSGQPKYLIIIAVIVILIIAAGITYLIISRNNADTKNENTVNSTNTVNNKNVVNTNTSVVNSTGNTNTSLPPELNINIPTNINTEEVVTDTDKDGLTDEEEKQLGTDKNSSDSDNDGLSDKQEVSIYNSDPNDEDTDNDGFSDGKEVEGGYDPTGPGKLFDINKAINS